MERSVLVMLSDRSSAPTLLGCRPSARKSLGRFQKRFQLLKKIIFCSLHKENNHSFKANSLLNRLCPRRYVGRGPDTMIVVVGDVLHTVSIGLLKSLFSVSVCRSPRMNHNSCNALIILQDCGYLRRNIKNTSTRETMSVHFQLT